MTKRLKQRRRERRRKRTRRTRKRTINVRETKVPQKVNVYRIKSKRSSLEFRTKEEHFIFWNELDKE